MLLQYKAHLHDKKPSLCSAHFIYFEPCEASVVSAVTRIWTEQSVVYLLAHPSSYSMGTVGSFPKNKAAYFAAAKNMVVSSTSFSHKEIHKQTWRSPDGKTNNQTDHILIDKRNASSILDVKSCRGASSDSDHFLVRGKYRCKIAYSKHELNRNTKNFP